MTQSLIKTSGRIADATSFRQALERTTPAPDNLYMWFGRSSAWTDDSNPPAPIEDISDEFTTRNNIIGAKKVAVTNTCFVCPRYNWTTGTIYTPYSSTDSNLFNEQFYVLTTDYNVYKCIGNNSGLASTTQPTGTSTATITTGDGYQWKFMYNLSTSVVTSFLNSTYLPIPSEGQKTSFQIAVEGAATYSSGSPVGGHGSNAVEELGGNRLMISQSFVNSESGVLPTNISYRQVGLWKNPNLISTEQQATGPVYVVNESGSNLDETTGTLLYVENRSPITRSADQTENIQFILKF